MKTSLIKRIELYAQKNPFWISGLDYEILALKAGYKASNCGRRLRELHTAGILERREVKGHVEYRYKESTTTSTEGPMTFIPAPKFHEPAVIYTPGVVAQEEKQEVKQAALI